MAAAIGFPKFDRLVLAAGDDSTIVGHHHAGRSATMSIEALELFAAIHLPELDGTVLTGTDQNVRIGTPGNPSDRRLVSDQIHIQATGISFPNMQASRTITRCHQHAVRAVLDAVNPVGVFFQFKPHITGARIKNSDNPLRSAQRDVGQVVIDVSTKNGIEFISDR